MQAMSVGKFPFSVDFSCYQMEKKMNGVLFIFPCSGNTGSNSNNTSSENPQLAITATDNTFYTLSLR